MAAENDEKNERRQMEEVLVRTIAAVEDAGIPYALMGGIASAAVGRQRHTRDIDLFVTAEDAPRVLEALARAGFRTERTDPRWLFKAFWDTQMVDIIFVSKGGIRFDEEMHARARLIEVAGRSVRLLPAEDILVIKALATAEHVPRHWYDALGILAAADLDWRYLSHRARPHLHRVLSLLLYAVSEGVAVPSRPLCELLQTTAEGLPASVAGDQLDRQGEADHGIAARVHEALATDSRVGELHLAVTVSGDEVAVKGKVATPERRQAVEQVVREAAPGRRVRNLVEVLT